MRTRCPRATTLHQCSPVTSPAPDWLGEAWAATKERVGAPLSFFSFFPPIYGDSDGGEGTSLRLAPMSPRTDPVPWWPDLRPTRVDLLPLGGYSCRMAGERVLRELLIPAATNTSYVCYTRMQRGAL